MSPDPDTKATIKRPVQKRSQATLERIFLATESLLAQKRFSKISIAEIAIAAECGVGTVYGRFKNKSALLSAMEQRVVQDIVDRQEALLKSKDWTEIKFGQRVWILTNHIAEGYKIHGPVLRELISRVQRDPGGATDDSRAKMNRVFQADVEFLVNGISSGNRTRMRKKIELALMAVIVTFQNRMLQIETSPIEQKFSDSFLKSELPQMMIAYIHAAVSE